MMKHVRRKSWAVATLCACAFASGVAVGAAGGEQVRLVEAYLRPDFRVTLDGKPVRLDRPILIYEGFSYLPLRAVGDLVGVSVAWDESSATIRLARPRPSPSTAPAPTPTIPTPPPLPTPTGSPTPTPYTPPDLRPLNELWAETPSEITLRQTVKYEIQYRGRTTPWFGIVDRNVIYIRLDDVLAAGIDVSGLKISREVRTNTYYVSMEMLKHRFTEQPLFRLVQGRLIIGETDEAKRRVLETALSAPGQVVHEVRKTGDNAYLLLVEYVNAPDDSRWYGYRIVLVRDYSGNWYVGSTSSERYALPSPTPR